MIPDKFGPIRWAPGVASRINRLPGFLQPFAVLVRNIVQTFLRYRRFQYPQGKGETLKALSFGVEYVYHSGVEGDIAEFGTMDGVSALAIVKTMKELAGMRPTLAKMHLFDSFQGFPEITTSSDKEAPQVKDGIWEEGSCKGLTKDELLDVCSKILPRDQLVVYDGWYSETLSTIPKGVKFSMVHLDCDLYQSAIEVLEYCFSNNMFSDGAIIFFDDWNCNRASPSYGERKAWAEVVDKFSVEFSDGGDYSWGGHKFIVHSYNSEQR